MTRHGKIIMFLGCLLAAFVTQTALGGDGNAEDVEKNGILIITTEDIKKYGVLPISSMGADDVGEYMRLLAGKQLPRFEEQAVAVNLAACVDINDLKTCERLLEVFAAKPDDDGLAQAMLLFRMGRQAESLAAFAAWRKNALSERPEAPIPFWLAYRNYLVRRLIMNGLDMRMAYMMHFSCLWNTEFVCQFGDFLKFLSERQADFSPEARKAFFDCWQRYFGDTLLMNLVILKTARIGASGYDLRWIDERLKACKKYISLSAKCPDALLPKLIDSSLFYGELAGAKLVFDHVGAGAGGTE